DAVLIDYIPNPLVIPVGLAIGVLIAAPVGPVNVLCIQRALERGFIGGVVAGLGAVLGDALIALSASLGVGIISGTVVAYRGSIQAIGGLALLAFGMRLWSKPATDVEPGLDSPDAPISAYLWDIPKTFLLTITNPGAVLGLFAIFGGIGTFVAVRGYIDALLLVGAIACGSFAWWVFLSMLTSRLRERFDNRNLRLINRGAGLLLICFGCLLIGELVLFHLDFLPTAPA
ncbi:MAG: LysE family translocator, partial [Hyphomicrobiaceae bacterium]